MKIVTIVGARPQFIKAAAVSREIAADGRIEEIIVHTGQHFDHNMSEVFFEEMEIPRPAYLLDVNSLEHGAMTGRMLERIEGVLLSEHPEKVIVYGDTNSTLAGALAAKKLHIDVVHVEAGLRSFNMRMPEEINRVLTDRISDVLCCPTENAVENLRREGFGAFSSTIVNTGDVMQDAALHYSKVSAERSRVLERLSLDGGDAFVLCTIHRAENTEADAIVGIVNALNVVSREMRVVLPLHPRTRNVIGRMGLEFEFSTVEPVGYFDMLELLRNCRIVMTDSGGLQKEAYFFRKACVTLREETEWVELCDAGVNLIAGSDQVRIVTGFRQMLNRTPEFDADLYGGGKAGRRIIQAVMDERS